MKQRASVIVSVVLGLGASVAAADTFGGMSGNEKVYLSGRDKICQPLTVTAAAARGLPTCKAAATDEIAALSVKTPSPERGSKAELSAAAKGRTITVSDKGGAVVVAWDAPDPVASVVDVWRSTYGKIVVVEYTVRRAGREVHELIGFDLGAGGKGGAVTMPTEPGPGTGTGTDAPAPVKTDPAVDKAAAKARKTSGKAALTAWQQVLGLDADHAEASYRLAVALAQTKRTDAAVAQLGKLAASTRPDAIEWLVEARFDKSFAKLLANPQFRTAVGLDRDAATPYERLMGFGGQWEQSLVPCDRPEIKLTFGRDRAFRLDFRSTCSGQREGFRLKGTWAMRGDTLELRLTNPDGGVDAAPCRFTRDANEDTLACQVDRDLTFEGRPVRR